MTARMTYALLRSVPVRLTVVEQHPEPSAGPRCSGVLEDVPQQDCLLTGMLLSVAMPRARLDARRPGAPPDSKRVARGDRRVDPCAAETRVPSSTGSMGVGVDGLVLGLALVHERP